MKRLIPMLILILIGLASCKKEFTPPESEPDPVKEWMKRNKRSESVSTNFKVTYRYINESRTCGTILLYNGKDLKQIQFTDTAIYDLFIQDYEITESDLAKYLKP